MHLMEMLYVVRRPKQISQIPLSVSVATFLKVLLNGRWISRGKNHPMHPMGT